MEHRQLERRGCSLRPLIRAFGGLVLFAGALLASAAGGPLTRTVVSIEGDAFRINGRPTYDGRVWQGKRVEGLLLNSRMVQATFDDRNPDTRGRWAYPDTGRWDPDRNLREFLAAMPTWRRHGLLAVTVNFQGGSPQGYSGRQPWHNSAFEADGSLRPDALSRMQAVLDRADSLGMVVILGVFYFGQDERLRDEAAVLRALDGAVDWVLARGYRNVLVEVNNECNVRYDHAVLRPDRVHELIERVKARARDGRRLLCGTSYGGGTIPGENVVRASDFLLLHGNGVSEPERIREMVRRTRRVPGYRPMPILFNEDDHFDFEQPDNNFRAAVDEYASWGFFDPGRNNYRDGYQSPPVRWDLNTPRKRAFFRRVAEITGSPLPEPAPDEDEGTVLGVERTWFTVGDRRTFLLGCSYYAGLGARPDHLERDLDELRRRGFNWIRVWVTWAAFGADVSAVDADGQRRQPYWSRLERLLAECDRRGMVVDLTLSRGNGVTGPSRLGDLQRHRRAVETLVGGLRNRRNWYLDLSNESNIQDSRHTPLAEIAELRAAARRLDPARLVTASCAGDPDRAWIRGAAQARLDFLAPHLPRRQGAPAATAPAVRTLRAWLEDDAFGLPIHLQEPFRRGYGAWNPTSEDFLADLRAARAAGAAGWCFHNGDQRAAADGRPRRSFDLRDRSLLEQLDEEELAVLRSAAREVR